MFLFDPTQDPRFREKCRELSRDPQLSGGRGMQRQETLLVEAALRCAQNANLPPGKKHNRPLLVLVPKSDVWAPLLDEDLVSEPIIPTPFQTGPLVWTSNASSVFRRNCETCFCGRRPNWCRRRRTFANTSSISPSAPWEQAPKNPIYLAVGKVCCSPAKYRAHWVTVPILYMFAKWTSGLLAGNATGRRRPRYDATT